MKIIRICLNDIVENKNKKKERILFILPLKNSSPIRLATKKVTNCIGIILMEKICLSMSLKKT